MPEAIYHQRIPQNTAYYQCVEDHLEAFDQVYADRFERQYGFFRFRLGNCGQGGSLG